MPGLLATPGRSARTLPIRRRSALVVQDCGFRAPSSPRFQKSGPSVLWLLLMRVSVHRPDLYLYPQSATISRGSRAHIRWRSVASLSRFISGRVSSMTSILCPVVWVASILLLIPRCGLHQAAPLALEILRVWDLAPCAVAITMRPLLSFWGESHQ